MSPPRAMLPGEHLPCLVRVALQGNLAAAVDCNGGLHYFDLKRGSRRRLWQESPFAGALCFARSQELLFSVEARVRVVDARQPHRVASTLLGHQEAVTHACATQMWAVTLSRDRLLLWQVSDWQLTRRVLGHVVAGSLVPSGQVGALHHDDRGQLRWSLWSRDVLRAERAVPRGPDGRPMLCLSQLACGEGYVAMAAKGAQHLLLLWRLREELPQQLQLSKPVRQIVANGLQLLALCRDELLLVMPATAAVRRVAWPGATLVAADGPTAVGLQRCAEGRLALAVQSLTRARTAKGPEGLGKTATELAQFLRRFGSFGARRAQCWQRLLELPEDREAYEQLEIGKLESRPRTARLRKLWQKLVAWQPALRSAPDQLVGLGQLSQVFSSKVLGFELCTHVLGRWPRCSPGALCGAQRLLHHVDEELEGRLCGRLQVLLQAMLDCFLARCLPRATWLVLWDHLLLCPPEGGLLAALAVLRIRREQLLQASEEAADVRFEEVLLSPLATDPVVLIKSFHGLKDASQQVQWDLAVGPLEETSEADTPPPPPPPESEELGAEDVEPAAWTDDEKEQFLSFRAAIRGEKLQQSLDSTADEGTASSS